MKKTGVLLINLGTPKSPKTGHVGSYLFEFLNDPRVMDIPWLLRKILVNIIIVPFRMFASAKEYKKLWTKKGSPLLYHSEELLTKVQNELGDKYGVHLAMRYNKPSIKTVLADMEKEQYDEIIVLPLYPQYASSSGGTAIEEVMKNISKWWAIPSIKIISEFFEDEGYLESIAARVREYDFPTSLFLISSSSPFNSISFPTEIINGFTFSGSGIPSSFASFGFVVSKIFPSDFPV